MNKTIKFTIFDAIFHFLVGMIFSITIGFGNHILTYIGLDSSMVGIIFSLSMVGVMLFQAVVSVLIENKKLITILQSFQIFTIISIMCGVGLLVFQGNKIVSSIIFLIALAISTSDMTTLSALTIDCINAGYNINFGVARALNSIGYAIIGFVGGVIIGKYGVDLTIKLYIIINIVILFTTLFFPSYEKTKEVVKKSGDSIYIMLKENKNFTKLLLGIVFIFFSHNLMNNFLKNIVENVGINSVSYGIIIGMAAFLEIPTMLAFSLFSKKFKSINLLKVSGIFMSIKIIIIAISWNFYGMMLAQIVQPLAYPLFTLVVIYYVNMVVKPRNHVKGQFLIGVASMGVGGSLGNILGGVLIRNIGVSKTMMIASVVTIIGATIFLTLKEESYKNC